MLINLCPYLKILVCHPLHFSRNENGEYLINSQMCDTSVSETAEQHFFIIKINVIEKYFNQIFKLQLQSDSINVFPSFFNRV